MEANNEIRAPVAEVRPPSAGQPVGLEPPSPSQPPPRPPLNRVDSRSSLPPQLSRPTVPPVQNQPQRPQFQPGGPVTNSPQFSPRPATQPRGPVFVGQPGSQQRPQTPPQRQSAPQQFIPTQGPRPLSSPTSLQPQQRALPPNNLQFGPRQSPQLNSAYTPEGLKPQLGQQSNGTPRNGVLQGPGPAPGQLPRQSSQGSLKGLDISNSYQNKAANLDNQSAPVDIKNVTKTENGIEPVGVAKGRSYSIAAAPGTPSPLKMEDDRRKSVSSISGKMDEIINRNTGLGLIQEGKTDSTDAVQGSRESIRSEISNESGKDVTERPESRLSGSKMTESFMGSLSNITKKKLDDDDDVVLQNNSTALKNVNDNSQMKTDNLDRSPSLTRSDDSPELKANPTDHVLPHKVQNLTSELQRPKTPKIGVEQEMKTDTKDANIKNYVTPNKTPSKSPIPDTKAPVTPHKKPNDLHMTMDINTMEPKMTPKKVASAPKSRAKDGDNDSGVDESTQGNDVNGSPGSPTKKLPSKLPTKEKSSNSLKALSRSSSKSATAKTPDNPPTTEKKKVPMNKVQVGNAPSPNIKAVKSKIGSLDNATYKPGGGRVKIENRKLEFKAAPKIAAKNETYTPSGGAKKILTTKLEWNAKSKIGSLQNSTYKPGGGDKKIETVKLDFKEKAKPKVASTVNITHKPGGGAIKSTVTKNGARAIENQKLEFKVQSKVGSLDNVKHKPGGGDVKIFDDKEYIKQISGQSPLPDGQSPRQESPVPSNAQPPKSDENLNQQQS